MIDAFEVALYPRLTMNELPIYGTGERAWLVGRDGVGKAVVLADSTILVLNALDEPFHYWGGWTALGQQLFARLPLHPEPYTIICELQVHR